MRDIQNAELYAHGYIQGQISILKDLMDITNETYEKMDDKKEIEKVVSEKTKNYIVEKYMEALAKSMVVDIKIAQETGKDPKDVRKLISDLLGEAII